MVISTPRKTMKGWIFSTLIYSRVDSWHERDENSSNRFFNSFLKATKSSKDPTMNPITIKAIIFVLKLPYGKKIFKHVLNKNYGTSPHPPKSLQAKILVRIKIFNCLRSRFVLIKIVPSRLLRAGPNWKLATGRIKIISGACGPNFIRSCSRWSKC